MQEQSSPELSIRGPEQCPHRAPASFTAHRDKSYRPVTAASWDILPSASDICNVSVVIVRASSLIHFDKRGPPFGSL